MDRKPKTVFQLDSPFTAVQWPQISSQNQVTILALLCSCLSPIGQYRANHVSPSKGKRDKKRKRREARSEEAPAISTPPPPAILSFIAVGLNTITRILESSSQKSKPKNAAVEGTGEGELLDAEEMSKESDPAKKVPTDDTSYPQIETHLSAIFVCRSSQPTILNEHLSQLVTTASLAHPELSATRLVELPKDSDKRLCEALGIPRVSFVGILEGAPHSKSLVERVRECVPAVEIPWLREATESRYLPVKINAIETFAPVAKKDQA